MNILLDTHILPWTLFNDMRLLVKARKLVENEENEIYYSIISLWEIEIKHLAHPDAMPVTAEEISGYCMQSGYQRLAIKENHIFAMEKLGRGTDTPQHKDPFDQLLVCQADVENMTFVTHDSLIPRYNKLCILEV